MPSILMTASSEFHMTGRGMVEYTDLNEDLGNMEKQRDLKLRYDRVTIGHRAVHQAPPDDPRIVSSFVN